MLSTAYCQIARCQRQSIQSLGKSCYSLHDYSKCTAVAIALLLELTDDASVQNNNDVVCWAAALGLLPCTFVFCACGCMYAVASTSKHWSFFFLLCMHRFSWNQQHLSAIQTGCDTDCLVAELQSALC